MCQKLHLGKPEDRLSSEHINYYELSRPHIIQHAEMGLHYVDARHQMNIVGLSMEDGTGKEILKMLGCLE